MNSSSFFQKIGFLLVVGMFITSCGSMDLTPVSLTPGQSTSSSPSATPDLSATRSVARQATQTQNAAAGATTIARHTENVQAQATNLVILATEFVRRTEESRMQATGLALTPTRTPWIPSNVSATQAASILFNWFATLQLPKPSSAPFDLLRGQQLIFHSGYVYLFGGRSVSDERLTNVYFSDINPDGRLAGWVETTPLPGKYYDHVMVKSGNFVYLLTGAAGDEDVYYAPLYANGQVGKWTKTASLMPSRQAFAAVSYKNFIYAAGGNSGGNQFFVTYSSVNEDGSLNPWTYTTPLPEAIQGHTMIAYDGYLYVFGGENGFGEKLTSVFYTAINSDGTLAGWKNTTPLPETMRGFSTFEMNGQVFLVGGSSPAYYTQILNNHALGPWKSFKSHPVKLLGMRAGGYNGYIYAFGGYDFSNYRSTALYAWVGQPPIQTITIIERPDCTSGWTRLKAGGQAIVSADTITPNRVRSGPSSAEPQVALLYPGVNFRLVEGPLCADGLVFWRVEHASIPTGTGWTAEGDGREYFLDPYNP